MKKLNSVPDCNPEYTVYVSEVSFLIEVVRLTVVTRASFYGRSKKTAKQYYTYVRYQGHPNDKVLIIAKNQ